ncbi:hypothetical protein HHI36_006136 [Cryptolaemus montrouzieri]|uniref:BED-type domain-containing protein n=1 Tax=Cryptolaemus montrouzieri TaxID=559131 RepID=A0ABD2NWC9_9CUCU
MYKKVDSDLIFDKLEQKKSINQNYHAVKRRHVGQPSLPVEEDHWLSSTLSRIKRSINNIFHEPKAPAKVVKVKKQDRKRRQPQLGQNQDQNDLSQDEDGDEDNQDEDDEGEEEEYGWFTQGFVLFYYGRGFLVLTIDNYFQRNRKRNENSGEKKRNLKKRKKYREYEDPYLNFGFTYITKGNVVAQCVVCLKVLASDNMVPNKLKCHLETTHSNLQGVPSTSKFTVSPNTSVTTNFLNIG